MRAFSLHAQTEYSASMTDNAIAYPPATLRTRLAAMIYELLLVLAVVFVASFAYIRLTGDAQTGWKHIVFQLFLLGVVFAYFSLFWLRSGQTLAMKTWRIKLVDRDGALLTLPRAALRFVLALFGLACFGITIVWALFDRDRQFLHDRLANTRLIYFKP